MAKSEAGVKRDAEPDADTRPDARAGATSSQPRRINVAVTTDMLAAIDQVIDREGVTLTEAVRRLIGLGDVVYRNVRIRGETLFFRGEDGKEREILLV